MAQLVFKYIQQNDLAKLRKFASGNEDALKNLKDQQGRTPLHWAAQLGNLEAVTELKNRGLACSAADNQGNLPIHLAAQQGSLEVITELLQGKAKISVKKRNKTGHTPLHYAAQHGHAAVVACLMEAGATIDVKDGDGLLPSQLVSTASPFRHELIQTLTSIDTPAAASTHGSAPIDSSPSSIPSPTPALLSERSGRLSSRTSCSSLVNGDGKNTARLSTTGLPLSESTGPLPTGIPRRPSDAQQVMTPPHGNPATATPSTSEHNTSALSVSTVGSSSNKAKGVESPTFSGWQGDGKAIPRAAARPDGPSRPMPVSIGVSVPARVGATNGGEPLSKLVKPQQGTPKQRAAPSPRANAVTPRVGIGYAGPRITNNNGSVSPSPATLSPPTFSLSPAIPNAAGHRTTSTPRASTTQLQQEAVVLELKSMIEQLTSRLETVEQKLKASEEGCRASEEGRRELEELALQTQHALNEQAERVEAAEARVDAAERQCADAQAALQQAQSALIRAGTHAQEGQMLTDQQRAKQDMALRDLTLSVQQLQTDVLGLTRAHTQHGQTQQAAQQAAAAQLEQLRQQVSQHKLEFTTAQSAVHAQLQAAMSLRTANGAPTTAMPPLPQAQLFAEPAAQHAVSLEQVESRVAELATALQLLGSRTVGQADLDSLRTRLTRLEAVGVSDQIQMLQLRAQQLSTTLADLNSKHLEAEEKLGALQRWQSEQVQLSASQPGHTLLLGGSGLKHPQASAGGQSDRSTSGSGLDGVSLQQLHTQVAALDSAFKDVQTQLGALKEQVTQLNSAPPTAPPTPTPMQAPQPTTPVGARRNAGMIGAAAGVETVDQLQKGLAEVARDVAELQAVVTELRAEVHVTTGNLRREWTDAVAQSGKRHAEQQAELASREAKLKSMKDSMFAESDSKQLVQALDARLGVALKDVDTRLGFLQHKMEVVEEQLQAAVQGRDDGA